MLHTLSGFGGIIGGATKGATISDCSSSASVKMSANTANSNGNSIHFGGIAGRIYGGNVEIRHCSNSGMIDNKHYNNRAWNSYAGNITGGIAGSISYPKDDAYTAVIDDCQNSGSVYAHRGAVGNIVGYISNGSITNSNTNSHITKSAPGGGIAGVANLSSISECYVKANIKTVAAGSTNADCGGIVGEAVSSTVDGCRYYGTLTPAAKVSTGGIIGKADDASSAGTTTSCGFGGTINGTKVTADNLNTYAIGSTTGTRGTFYLWDGTL